VLFQGGGWPEFGLAAGVPMGYWRQTGSTNWECDFRFIAAIRRARYTGLELEQKPQPVGKPISGGVGELTGCSFFHPSCRGTPPSRFCV
jgi:hypothetical protein